MHRLRGEHSPTPTREEEIAQLRARTRVSGASRAFAEYLAATSGPLSDYGSALADTRKVLARLVDGGPWTFPEKRAALRLAENRYTIDALSIAFREKGLALSQGRAVRLEARSLNPLPSKTRREIEDEQIARAVYDRHKAGHKPIDVAFRLVGESFGKAEKTIERAYYRHRKRGHLRGYAFDPGGRIGVEDGPIDWDAHPTLADLPSRGRPPNTPNRDS